MIESPTIPVVELPSDVTPGVVAPTLDWNEVTKALDGIEEKINVLWPVVKRKGGGLFMLYHSGFAAEQGVVAVQAASAQMIVDYYEAAMPRGTKIQWVILP
jgi:hypothetical protein